MNKSTLKFIADFGPLLIFFIYYKKFGMTEAILPLIIATIVATGILYFVEKKIPKVPIISAVIVSLFGGLTLYFDNKIFFYMKPTIVNLLFAFVLFFGSFFLKKNLLKSLLESSIQLEERGWELLNKRWMIFFIFLAFLNEIVWRTQTEDFWVKFKVFGIIPITFIFMIFQINLIKKYKINV
ncbi:MAG: intracellular septation protein A [Pelagibacteraceae bacterium]|nr:intracellular septation protein A [Pelagibacteraceae bacterium]OUV88968.1 MAG: intracellular septation protein A [Pelagibacteraceae bacterium TMED146]|tara:strand:+ start:7372 stop:7917 length:546 start_codon:yes stop_codon:yes gene_type:complete